MGYVDDLRLLAGTRPLILVGAAVIVRDKRGAILLQRRGGKKKGRLHRGGARTGGAPGRGRASRSDRGDQVHNVNLIFTTSAWEGGLRPDPVEIQELRFFSAESLPEEISPPDRPGVRWYAAPHRSN